MDEENSSFYSASYSRMRIDYWIWVLEVYKLEITSTPTALPSSNEDTSAFSFRTMDREMSLSLWLISITFGWKPKRDRNESEKNLIMELWSERKILLYKGKATYSHLIVVSLFQNVHLHVITNRFLLRHIKGRKNSNKEAWKRYLDLRYNRH